MEASPARRKLASQIAVLKRHHGPDDPRLPELRRQLDRLRIEEIASWVEAARVNLPDSGEVTSARHEADRVTAEMRSRPGRPGEAA